MVSIAGSSNLCVARLCCTIVFSWCAYPWHGKFLWSTHIFPELCYILSLYGHWNWGCHPFWYQDLWHIGFIKFFCCFLSFLVARRTLVSFTKDEILLHVLLFMSPIRMRNNTDPRTVPCGTLLITLYKVELAPFSVMD